jgi:hypothetical protein
VIGTALDVWEIVAASRSFGTPSEMAAATDRSESSSQYPTIDTIAVGDWESSG